jgi:hypothetical protein
VEIAKQSGHSLQFLRWIGKIGKSEWALQNVVSLRNLSLVPNRVDFMFLAHFSRPCLSLHKIMRTKHMLKDKIEIIKKPFQKHIYFLYIVIDIGIHFYV